MQELNTHVKELFMGHDQCEPDGTRLHHSLILAFTCTPVLVAFRIRSTCQSTHPGFRPFILFPTCQQADKTPKRPSKRLELTCSQVVVRPRGSKSDECSSRRSVRCQGIQYSLETCNDVGTIVEGVSEEAVVAIEEDHLDVELGWRQSGGV